MAIIFIIGFAYFVFKYETISKQQDQSAVEDQANVVASSVWTLFTPLTEEYLRLSVRRSGYKKVSITTLNGLQLFSYENDLTGIDKFFQEIGAISTNEIAVPIIYKSLPIGTLTVEVYNKRFYTYTYLVIVLLLTLALIWFVTTITADRKRLRLRIKEKTKDLRISEERLQRAVSGTRDGLWDWNLQTNEAYISDRFSTMLGYEPGELPLTGDTWTSLIHPEDLELAQASLHNYLEKKVGVYVSTFRMRTKDGTYRWITGRGEAVWDKEGAPIRITGFNTDITEQKQAEQRVKAEQDQLFTILNSIDANVYVADMQTYEILFMNKNMIEDFGQDLTGGICWEVFRGESAPCEICTHHLLVDENGQPTGVHTWNNQNPLNGKYYINNDRAIEWADGRLVHLQISTDISHIKTMEQQLYQKKKMEAVGYMAGGMAHNFNNNLSIILGNLEITKMKLPAHPEIDKYLGQAKIAVLRSRDLIKNIITYSRKGIQDKAIMKLKPVIDETVNLLSVTLPSSVQIQTIYAPTCSPVFIHADASQMQEVIINLCNNAIHAMDEEGELKISLEPVELEQTDIPIQYDVIPGRHVKLSIQDTGHGISADMIDKIFDPFFSTKEAHEGTGMGLSTVQGIVAQHNGLIKVNSTLGQGTTFELYFPIASTTETQAPTIDTSLPEGAEGILFVDDNEELVTLSEQLLTELGYQVTTMTDSQEALKLFTAHADKFQLLITDQTMPELSGKDLIAAVKVIRPDLPTILCTGFSRKIDGEQARDLGISAFLLKPLVLSELAQAVRRVLDEGEK